MQRGFAILLIELVEPERQVFHKAFAGAEAMVMVVFEIGEQLKSGDSVENRPVLPTHHLCQQLLGILVSHCAVLRLKG